jgi:hypothetical protein
VLQQSHHFPDQLVLAQYDTARGNPAGHLVPGKQPRDAFHFGSAAADHRHFRPGGARPPGKPKVCSTHAVRNHAELLGWCRGYREAHRHSISRLNALAIPRLLNFVSSCQAFKRRRRTTLLPRARRTDSTGQRGNKFAQRLPVPVHPVEHHLLLTKPRHTRSMLSGELGFETREYPGALAVERACRGVWVAKRPHSRAPLNERSEQAKRTLTELSRIVYQHEPRHPGIFAGAQHFAGGAQEGTRRQLALPVFSQTLLNHFKQFEGSHPLRQKLIGSRRDARGSTHANLS